VARVYVNSAFVLFGCEYVYAALFGVLSLSLIFIIEVKATYNKYLEANRPSEQDIAEIGNV